MGLCASQQAVEPTSSESKSASKPIAQPKPSQPSAPANNNNTRSSPVIPPSASPHPSTRESSGSISITAPISTTPRRKPPSNNNQPSSVTASPSTSSPIASRSPSSEVADPMSKLSASDSTKNLLAINSKIADTAKFENVLLSLKQIPILSRLTDDERLKLAVHLKEKSYSDTTKIVTEGDVGHEFFIIKEGECFVTKFSAESKESIRLATLKKGDYFGEKALINNEPRAASVVAHGPCVCFYMDRTAFHELFGNHVNVQFAKRHAISAEVGTSFHKAYIAPQNVNRVKDGQIRGLIHNALQKNVILCALDREQHDQVCEEMWQKKIEKGVSIINQGEDGDNFYVIESGEFEVFVTRDGKKAKKVAILRAGQSFGELALMYNAPRAATVTAAADAVVWAVDRYAFRRIVAKVSQHKLDEYNHFLQNVPVLAPLASYERAKIAEALEEIYFNAGDIIIKQGDEGDAFYILKSGEVLCTRREETAPDVSVEVKRYYPGEYFGERALLKKEPRAATLTAVTACTCLCLDRQAFTLLLGPLEDIMQKRLAQYSSSSKSLLSSREESVEFQPKEKPVSIELKDLVVVGTLGKGSFGHVQLVKHKATNETYALKTVSKFQVVQLGQQEHLINESHVMAVLNHPNLIRLHARFQDKNCLYFVMELCLGGELFTVLRERTLFDEKTAKFYAASVVLAFEYMHSKDIVYRDLKPENLLLDKQGYLKITDFGFAKVCKNRTWTLCGTPDYLAPEVVSGAGHGKPVDWWTLGIFIFEMLASYPPFYDEDPVKTYAKIMQGDITFPRHFTPDAVSLVAGLLHPKSTRRLGSGKGGAKQIKEHPWFAKFDWDALTGRTMPAPIIPRIKHELDLSNFEKYPDSGEKIHEFDDSQQFLFKDF